ncbi:nucleolar protein 9 isoform X2 [Hemicordylus capensis]|uniref:nucleolar protein 9 isoform X2 n=1 Tax=Hemicordylus capensis TaxID=884348 RepID=UPI00230249E2|nr:nucleolar protein 9 isoform X2 [Hemicordylus capensis]
MGVPPQRQKGAGHKKERRKRPSPAASSQEGGSKENKGGLLPKLEPATSEYFRRAHETFKSGFDSEEEKGLFVGNVLEEAEAVAVPLALDAAGSLLLQALLPSASSVSLCRLLRALIPSLPLTARNPCGAHILEAALLRAPLLIRDGAEDAGMLEDLVLELGRASQEELSVFASDAHASFVVRTLLQTLAGVRVGSDGGRGIPGAGVSCSRAKKAKLESDGPVEFEVPDTFLSLLQEFGGCFQERISEFISNKFFSLCLQVALEVLHRKLPEACSQLCRSVVAYLSSCNPSAGQSVLLVFLKDATCSRVLDKVLEVSDPKALRSFYKDHVKGQLQVLASHGVANFTLQRLIQAASCKLLGKLFEELSPGLEEILALEHSGVITALLGACRKHGAHQQEALQLLMEAFHCWEPPSRQLACAPLIASVLAYEVYYGEEEEEAPSQSKGCYVSLACSKHGSRVLDAVWSKATLPAKREMAQELAEHEQQLRHDPFGHHLIRNFALTHFLKRRQDWERHQEAEKKRRELFAEILED